MSSRTKRVKIETLGGQAFNVPNNGEGRTFLRLMRRFINRPTWRFSARGRGARLRPGDTHVSFSRSLSLPQGESEWLAVYMGGTGGWGNFRSLLSPGNPPTPYYTGVPLTPPGSRFTPEEQALLESIMGEAEEKYDSQTFYSVFQKLVDI